VPIFSSKEQTGCYLKPPENDALCHVNMANVTQWSPNLPLTMLAVNQVRPE